LSRTVSLALVVIFGLLPLAASQAAELPQIIESVPYSHYQKTKILVTTYRTDRWSHQGRYKVVSKGGKRLGNYVALNFLPGGSFIMIPELFKTTTLEVADTFGGKGYGYYKGKKYWKVDILRDKGEWMDDFDHPLDLYVVKYNYDGPVKNQEVRLNCQKFMRGKI
jgi:hypothetical protein